MFAMPSSAFWVSRRYNLPFLAVILSNGGWNAPKFSALGVHPTGYASKSSLEELHISFDPPADYGMIAEAAGAWSITVKEVQELEGALNEGIKKVQGGQSAVVNVFVKN
jgi:thiamine pyrophosphate-dependent acetolactate synthase large subunit-like protein